MKTLLTNFKSQVKQSIDIILQYPPVHLSVHVLLTLKNDMTRSDLMKQASGMAYVTLLSLVPSLAAVFALISVFTPLVGEGGALTEKLQALIIENLAQGAGQQASVYLNEFIASLDITKIGISSFVGLLVTLVLLLRQIEAALNRIWQVRKNRNVFTRFIYFWTFLTLGTFAGSVAFGVISGFDLSGLSEVSQYKAPETVSVVGKSLIGLSIGFIIFFFIYKVVPNCRVSLMEAGIGAVIASVLFQQASRGFTLYVKYFSNHKAIYGALAALPVFLTWLYIVWMIILLGAVISWRVQQGFPKKEVKSDENELTTSAKEKLENLRLKSLIPLFALVNIHQKFTSGDGKGLTGNELARILKLPGIWVSDALDALIELGYVLPGGEDQLAGPLDRSYFPAIPSEKISLKQMFDDILEPASSWLLVRQKNSLFDMSGVLSTTMKLKRENANESSLADILAEIEPFAAQPDSVLV